MAAKSVTTIPANISQYTSVPLAVRKKRRVAGYARVSTGSDEQFTSYEAQVDYYTNFIKSREDWEFVKVYTDEGISGTSTAHREGFKSMIADALAGKIDLIVTKSVSRFARNTVDSLSAVRRLKENGVEIYFEKENIWTFEGRGELLISIMSSLAQEESRSISENVKWGHRKRFADGKVSVAYSRFLGYDKGEDGNLALNEKEAVIVRRIYAMFLQGMTPHGIAKRLTGEGIPSPAGKDHWVPTTVKSILTNEKMKGDALLQKSYTVDYLTKKTKINEGEVPQYYIEASHEAIIDPAEWDAVQDEIARRKAIGNAYSGTSVLSAKIVCGDCGAWYGPKVWHSTDKYRTVIWQCNSKFSKGKKKCSTPHVSEEEIKRRFLQAYNSLISDKAAVVAACDEAEKTLTDTTELDAEMSELKGEIDVIIELTRKCIAENSSSAQDQVAYMEKYNGYVEKYERAKKRFDALVAEKERKEALKRNIGRFLFDLSSREELLTEFDDCLWLTVVERVTVRNDGVLVFGFYNCTEIEE